MPGRSSSLVALALLATLTACRCGDVRREVLRVEVPIREGPGAADRIVGWGHRGELIRKLGGGAGAIRVTTEGQVTGWIPAGLVVAAPAAMAAVVGSAPIFRERVPEQPEAMVEPGRLAFVLEESGQYVRIEVADDWRPMDGDELMPSRVGWTLRGGLDWSEREVAAARRFEWARALAKHGARDELRAVVAAADPGAGASAGLRRFAEAPAPQLPHPPPAVARPSPAAEARQAGAALEPGSLLDEEHLPIPSAELAPGALVEVMGVKWGFLQVALPEGGVGLAPPWLVDTAAGEVAVARALASIRDAPSSDRPALTTRFLANLRREHPEARLLPLLEGLPVAPVICQGRAGEAEADPARAPTSRPASSAPENVYPLPDGAGPSGPQPTYDWATFAEQAHPGFQVDSPLPPALRAMARQRQRDNDLRQGDYYPAPVELTFEVPPSARQATYHRLSVKRFEPVTQTQIVGHVVLNVDHHGCEVGPRRFYGLVEAGPEPPGVRGSMLVWLGPHASWTEQADVLPSAFSLAPTRNRFTVRLPGGREYSSELPSSMPIPPAAAHAGRLTKPDAWILVLAFDNGMEDGETAYLAGGAGLVRIAENFRGDL